MALPLQLFASQGNRDRCLQVSGTASARDQTHDLSLHRGRNLSPCDSDNADGRRVVRRGAGGDRRASAGSGASRGRGHGVQGTDNGHDPRTVMSAAKAASKPQVAAATVATAGREGTLAVSGCKGCLWWAWGAVVVRSALPMRVLHSSAPPPRGLASVRSGCQQVSAPIVVCTQSSGHE